jgi:hypothetical protein
VPQGIALGCVRSYAYQRAGTGGRLKPIFGDVAILRS